MRFNLSLHFLGLKLDLIRARFRTALFLGSFFLLMFVGMFAFFTWLLMLSLGALGVLHVGFFACLPAASFALCLAALTHGD